jgi:hypothetical protein
MSVSAILGTLVEKLTEERGREAARWILSELHKHAGPAVNDLIGTYVPDILGAQVGAQQVLSELQRRAGPMAARFASKYGHGIVGQGVEQFLQANLPELDEIPGELLEWVSETRLAEIGRTSLDHLSAEARSRIEKAGYTSTQIGAAVMTHVVNVLTHLGDRADGDSETAR